MPPKKPGRTPKAERLVKGMLPKKTRKSMSNAYATIANVVGEEEARAFLNLVGPVKAVKFVEYNGPEVAVDIIDAVGHAKAAGLVGNDGVVNWMGLSDAVGRRRALALLNRTRTRVARPANYVGAARELKIIRALGTDSTARLGVAVGYEVVYNNLSFIVQALKEGKSVETVIKYLKRKKRTT